MAKPLKPGVALEKARRLLEDGHVTSTPHIRRRMKQPDRDFDMEDVANVFESGRINRPEQWDKEHKTWKYIVDGQDVEGEPLSIVFAFNEDDDLVLITGIR